MPDVSHVGRRYEAKSQVIEAERAKAFAQAVAGGDEVFEPTSVPPIFASVYCLFPTLGQLFGDQEVGINLAGLVHGEQTYSWPTPIHVGDVVDSSAEISAVEEKRGMTFVTIAVNAVRQGDSATVCTGSALMIIRGG